MTCSPLISLLYDLLWFINAEINSKEIKGEQVIIAFGSTMYFPFPVDLDSAIYFSDINFKRTACIKCYVFQIFY